MYIHVVTAPLMLNIAPLDVEMFITKIKNKPWDADRDGNIFIAKGEYTITGPITFQPNTRHSVLFKSKRYDNLIFIPGVRGLGRSISIFATKAHIASVV